MPLKVAAPVVNTNNTKSPSKSNKKGCICGVSHKLNEEHLVPSPLSRSVDRLIDVNKAKSKPKGELHRARSVSGSSKGRGTPSPTPSRSSGYMSRGSTPLRTLSREADPAVLLATLPSVHIPLNRGIRHKTLSGDSCFDEVPCSKHPNGIHRYSSSESVTPRKKNMSGSSSGSGSTNSSKKDLLSRQYEQHLTLFQVQSGLKKGELLEGVLRINPKNYEDAYISAPDELTDIYICGVRDRNRALHGDEVVVRVNNSEDWKVLYENIQSHVECHPEDEIFGSGCAAGGDKSCIEGQPKDEICASGGGAVGGEDQQLVIDEWVAAPSLDNVKAEGGKSRRGSRGKGEKKALVPSSLTGIITVLNDGADSYDDFVCSSKENMPPAGKKKKKTKAVAPHELLESAGGISSCDGDSDIILSDLDEVDGEANLPDLSDLKISDEHKISEIKDDLGDSNRLELSGHSNQKITDSELLQVDTKQDELDQNLPDLSNLSLSDTHTINPELSEKLTDSSQHQKEKKQKRRSERKSAGTEHSDNSSIGSESSKHRRRSRNKKRENVENDGVKSSSNLKVHTRRSDTNMPKSNPNSPKCNTNTQRPMQHTSRETKFDKLSHVTLEMVLKHPKWGKFVQRTATVVHILRPINPRTACGHLRLYPDKNPRWALFSPRDHRMPRMKIAAHFCPADFYTRCDDYANTLFVAKITEWSEITGALGKLVSSLGDDREIEPQSIAILEENGMKYADFTEEVLRCLPTLPFTIPKEEIQKRKDLRAECILTIDPATARDLDDAVHCKALGDGMYEVGVHIADVSYFVEEGSALDYEALERATSVYLVQRMIPMLPAALCTDVCSLAPEEDRLCFSVIWKMNESGQVHDQWIGRSVIKSRIKMSYEHAQSIIDNKTDVPYPEDITNTVLLLQKISSNLRKTRFDGGALNLEQSKVAFVLDKDAVWPVGFSIYQHSASHRLIEELMLLANQSIAKFIHKHFPNIAMLRRHPQPQRMLLDELQEQLETVGVLIDMDKAGDIHKSLEKWRKDPSIYLVLTNLLAKPMQMAKYFCSGTVSEKYRGHYALNVDLYTHFTSPIRRYPDLVVHRLLTAGLKNVPMPKWEKIQVHKWADHCNMKKLSAKVCSESSSDLFLAQYIRTCGPLTETGIVMDVKDYSCDVLMLRMAAIRRFYVNRLPVQFKYTSNRGVGTLDIVWSPSNLVPQGCTQKISLFSKVQLELSSMNDPIRFNVVLLPPMKTDHQVT